MKKVLVICDLFPPAFGPRMGYLCKYLKHYNWEPVILTEAVEEKTFTFLAGKDKVTYVKMNADKALEVIERHLVGGHVVEKYTLSAAGLK